MVYDDSNPYIIQKYFFKSFLIKIFSFPEEEDQKRFEAVISNHTWKTPRKIDGKIYYIPNIRLKDESEGNLRNRVSSLLNEPNLEKRLMWDIYLGENSKWELLGIVADKVEKRPYDDSTYEEYNPENPFHDFDYDVPDDTHDMEWNEAEEEWSNEGDYS